MRRLLIIPNINDMEKSLAVADEYNVGFEYNDFYDPDVLDDESRLNELVDLYKGYKLPEYTTMHGAFYDVIPFSKDKKIKEISILRIEQSIQVAKRIGARSVIFHTNYNPFLNSDEYLNIWLSENIKFWSGILEKYSDINIYLENMFDNSPIVLEKLSNELSKYENYGVCFDLGHVAISKTSLNEWVSSLGRYVKHIHINDNDLISDLHLAWGDCKIERESFYEYYSKYMSAATVLVETSDINNAVKSLKKLEEEGFLSDLHRR